MIETLSAFGGIYIAAFVLATISGVFPLVSSELFLVGLSLSTMATPKLVLVASIVACGQTVSHSSLFLAAREVTSLGTKKRKKLEQRIAKARAVVERWKGNVPLLLCTAAVFGLPPMMLVAIASGALGIRFRTFVVIGVGGRIARFIGLVLIARYVTG